MRGKGGVLGSWGLSNVTTNLEGSTREDQNRSGRESESKSEGLENNIDWNGIMGMMTTKRQDQDVGIPKVQMISQVWTATRTIPVSRLFCREQGTPKVSGCEDDMLCTPNAC